MNIQGYNELYSMIKGAIRECESFGVVIFNGYVTKNVANNWSEICEALISAFFDHYLTFNNYVCTYAQKEHTGVPIRVIHERTSLPCVQLCNVIVPHDSIATAREFVKIYTQGNGSPPKEHLQFAGISPELPLWEIYTYIVNRASSTLCTSDALIIWHKYPRDASLMYTHKFTIDAINLYAEMCKTVALSPQERWTSALAYCVDNKELQKIVEISKLYAVPCIYKNRHIYPDSPDGRFLGIALQQALYEMLYAVSPAEGIRRIRSRGGFIELNTLVYSLILP